MLGMMNCPTDNVEFYSASPSMKRSIEEHASTCDKLQRTVAASSSANANADNLSCSDSDSDVVRVFSEARDKPHFTYTSDGRKLVDGKEETTTNAARDPLKMWDRLILSRVVATKMEPDDRRRNSESADATTNLFLDVAHGKPRSESVSVSVIAHTTVVHNANPSLKQKLTKKRSDSAPKLPSTAE